MLWHKNDYCDRHQKFHMKALYVGKGGIKWRIPHHWRTKNTSNEMLIYFSFTEIENRMAKYIEQLFLDLYHFPLNRSENPGTRLLCMYCDQGEVD